MNDDLNPFAALGFFLAIHRRLVILICLASDMRELTWIGEKASAAKRHSRRDVAVFHLK